MKKNDKKFRFLLIFSLLCFLSVGITYGYHFFAIRFPTTGQADESVLFDSETDLIGEKPSACQSGKVSLIVSSGSDYDSCFVRMNPFSYIANNKPLDTSYFSFFKISIKSVEDETIYYTVYFAKEPLNKENFEKTASNSYTIVGLAESRIDVVSEKQIENIGTYPYFMILNKKSDSSKGKMTVESLCIGLINEK